MLQWKFCKIQTWIQIHKTLLEKENLYKKCKKKNFFKILSIYSCLKRSCRRLNQTPDRSTCCWTVCILRRRSACFLKHRGNPPFHHRIPQQEWTQADRFVSEETRFQSPLTRFCRLQKLVALSAGSLEPSDVASPCWAENIGSGWLGNLRKTVELPSDLPHQTRFQSVSELSMTAPNPVWCDWNWNISFDVPFQSTVGAKLDGPERG